MTIRRIALALALLLATGGPAWATSSPGATGDPLQSDSSAATAPVPGAPASGEGRQPKSPQTEWAQARTADGTALPLALDHVLGRMVAVLRYCHAGDDIILELGRRARIGVVNLHQAAGTTTSPLERREAIVQGGMTYVGRPVNCATVSNRLWFWAEGLQFLAETSTTNLMFSVMALDVLSRDVAKALDTSRTHPAHHDG